MISLFTLPAKQTILLRGTGDVLIDRGATDSVTPDEKLLHGFVSQIVETNDYHGGTATALGYGYMVVDIDGYYVKTKTYYVPTSTDLICNEYDLLNAGCHIDILSREPVVKQLRYHNQILPLTAYDKVFYLSKSHIVVPSPSIVIRSLHTKFAHVNARTLLDSIKHNTISNVPSNSVDELKHLLTDHDCHACLLAKARRSYAIEGSRDKYSTSTPFSIVYTDVCQVVRSLYKDRPLYFVSFKCDTTGFVKIYPITTKDQVLNMSIGFQHNLIIMLKVSLVIRDLNTSILVL